MNLENLVLMCLLIALSRSSNAQQDVFASEQMRGPWPDNTVLLEAGPGETLVFRQTDPPYVLDGKKLIIAANNVRVEGTVVIRAFRNDDIAIAKPGVGGSESGGTALNGKNGGPGSNRPPCLRVGCNGGGGGWGKDGLAGDPGKGAGNVKLQFPQIVGNGRLVIAAVGQQAQQGQRGGRGGAGGKGGKGKSKTCADPVPKGRGGDGGPAGSGGDGGSGGLGAPGGWIQYARSLKAAISSGQITLYFNGGFGGFAGLGGDPGDPGTPGEGADGTDCDSASPPGNYGASGISGDKGFQGKDGSAGFLSCYDCSETEKLKQATEHRGDKDDSVVVLGAAFTSPSQEVNNHGERKRVSDNTKYLDVLTADGKDCAAIIPDAFRLGVAEQLCHAEMSESPIYHLRLLEGSSATFVILDPTAAGVQLRKKEVCDVFLSCK